MIEQLASGIALYGCAWLLFLVVRSRDITVLVKSRAQRTAGERKRVACGLLRGMALEIFLFVPASATIVWLIAPLFLPDRLTAAGVPRTSVYACLGLISYGFPFASVRHMVTRIALRTLQEFATITQGNIEEQDGG